MKKGLLEKIKSRGYFRINFQPTVYKIKLERMQDCKEMVEGNAVRLRGWDYPHIPRKSDATTGEAPYGKYWEGWIDWENYKEFWRIYKSGQFLHYMALREDWYEEATWFGKSEYEEIPPMVKLNIISSVTYEMTEIFEFLLRLVSAGLYDEGVTVNISLHNTEGRELWISEPMRAPFFRPYVTGAKNIYFEKQFSKDDIVEQSRELSINAMLYIFDNFGWNDPSVDTLKKDQKDLLAGAL